jgi:hypothetical protein
MNSSPRMKLSSLNLKLIDDSPKKAISFLDDFKGKRIIPKHPNLQDNVIFDAQETSHVSEHIDKLMNYYSRLSEHERHYNHSPDLYSFYHRERVSPLCKYSKKVRHLDISPDNPYRECIFLFIKLLLLILKI